MEERDFSRIEQMVANVVTVKLGQFKEEIYTRFDRLKSDIDNRFVGFDKKFTEIDERFVEFDKKFTEIDKKFVEFDKKLIKFKEEIKEDFRIQTGILNEDFQHKLQLVAEGHQMLSEKIDRVEERLEKKIADVAAELAAHRADTEGHKRGYMIREPGE